MRQLQSRAAAIATMGTRCDRQPGFGRDRRYAAHMNDPGLYEGDPRYSAEKLAELSDTDLKRLHNAAVRVSKNWLESQEAKSPAQNALPSIQAEMDRRHLAPER